MGSFAQKLQEKIFLAWKMPEVQTEWIQFQFSRLQAEVTYAY